MTMSDPSDPREDVPDDEQPDERELEQDLGEDEARRVEDDDGFDEGRLGEPESIEKLSETAQRFLAGSD
jgi:hypothetical protein